MPVFRAKLLMPQFLNLEATNVEEAAQALLKHAEVNNGVLLQIEPMPLRIEEAVATPPGGEAA